MSREFFAVFDETTGEELSRGSGPAGSAGAQPVADGRVIKVIPKELSREPALRLTDGEVVPE